MITIIVAWIENLTNPSVALVLQVGMKPFSELHSQDLEVKLKLCSALDYVRDRTMLDSKLKHRQPHLEQMIATCWEQ